MVSGREVGVGVSIGGNGLAIGTWTWWQVEGGWLSQGGGGEGGLAGRGWWGGAGVVVVKQVGGDGDGSHWPIFLMGQ